MFRANGPLAHYWGLRDDGTRRRCSGGAKWRGGGAKWRGGRRGGGANKRQAYVRRGP
jgi:hypothetical protein